MIKPCVSVDWGLLSPPKPYVFVSLPVQSGWVYSCKEKVIQGLNNFTFNKIITLVFLIPIVVYIRYKYLADPYISYYILVAVASAILKVVLDDMFKAIIERKGLPNRSIIELAQLRIPISSFEIPKKILVFLRGSEIIFIIKSEIAFINKMFIYYVCIINMLFFLFILINFLKIGRAGLAFYLFLHILMLLQFVLIVIIPLTALFFTFIK